MIYEGRVYPKIQIGGIFNGNLGILAKNRGYDSIKDAVIDSNKSYTVNKHNPFLMEDMDNLVERVVHHVKAGSSIMIFGDYDVDGISASAVMLKGLSYMGLSSKLSIIIPNRVIGYSIKKEYIIEELNKGIPKPDLIITVDCGIKNVSDVDYIVNELGIEVIVTDHHGVDDDNLPLSASAIVNPHRRNSLYPFQEISGSLVALKVMEALNTVIPYVDGPNGNPNKAHMELEELAMLGTISDVMPIHDENKWLVKETLPRLANSQNLGLQVFTNHLRKNLRETTKDADYNTDFIGWSVGPRINAAGRIDNPYIALEMFLTNSKQKADTIYKHLDSTNSDRQDMVREDYDTAKEEVDLNNSGIVYVNKNIADGVIGLIAGRLKEDFYLPTIVLGANNNGIYKGSCRSIEGLNIYEALTYINDYFIKNHSKDENEPLMLGFGGHPLAAGLSLKEEYIPIFIELFTSYCNKMVTEEMKERELYVDGVIDNFSSIGLETIKELKLFGPYGQGNLEPLFLFLGRVNLIERIGKTGKLVGLRIEDTNGNILDTIYFRYGYNDALKQAFDYIIDNNYNGEIGVVGKLKKNYFQGHTNLQIQIEDLII